ncbi:MAG: Hsp70 family protein, partial [Anaerolineae bacterium]
PIDAVLVDVTPFSLGIEIATQVGDALVPDIYRPIIRRNTAIPCTHEEVFRTVYSGQDTVEIAVYQGEHPVASQNRLLGRFRIEGLQPEAPGEPARVTVRFDMDINGELRVQATDRKTGQRKAITVMATKERLSAEELNRATVQMAALLAAQETMPDSSTFETGEVEVMLNRARQLLQNGRLEMERVDQIQAKIDEIEQARREGDRVMLAKSVDELVDILFEIEV